MNVQRPWKGIWMMVMVVVSMACAGKESSPQIEKMIVAREKAILDEWGKGRTMIFPANSADEITYFDPSLSQRLDGITAFRELLKPIENRFTIERYDMVNPKVQLCGEIAVLTYNLVDYAKNAQGLEQKFYWNTTEVYRKIGDDWKIIHSHWSFTKPQVK